MSDKQIHIFAQKFSQHPEFATQLRQRWYNLKSNAVLKRLGKKKQRKILPITLLANQIHFEKLNLKLSARLMTMKFIQYKD